MYSSLANFINKKFRIDAHYFLKGGFWLSLAQLVTIALGLITTALFAYFLNENDYGIYRYLVGLAALFSAFSLTGIGQAVLQTAAKKYYSFYSETLKINFIYSVGIFLGGSIGSIYYWLNDNHTLSIGCLLIAVFQPLINTFQYTPSYLQGTGQFRKSTEIQSVRTVVSSLVSVLVLLLTQNIIALFATFLITSALASFVTHLWYSPLKADPTPLKVKDQYISYAKNSSLRNAVSSIAFRADAIFIFTQLGAVELAVYSIATLVPEQIKGSFKNLASLLLPKYSSHTNEKILLGSVPRRSLQICAILLITTILYVVIAPYFYNLFFPKYQSSILYSQIYALAFPSFFALIPLTVIQSRLDENALNRINNQNTFLSLFLVILLTSFYGVMGAIIGKVLSRYINAFYIYFKFHKINKAFSVSEKA